MIINGKEITPTYVASLIDDSTIRREDPAVIEAVRTGDLTIVDEAIGNAIKYGFRCIYIPHDLAKYASEKLAGSSVKLGVGVDLDNGDASPKVKTTMIKEIIASGAEEVDTTIDLISLKQGKYDKVIDGIKAAVDACDGRLSKIICEVGYLTRDEMLAASECVQKGGADYYKTSAFRGGADMDRICELRESLTDSKLKIAGTGQFWSTSVFFGSLAAGADIYGVRNGAKIINEIPIFEEIYSRIKF